MSAKSLMILGTASGVGKSLLTAGFCRLFSDAGYRVAPFKAQNMSNNSYVTIEGGEIGRAQAVQAECARIQPHTDMNPVLLKPAMDDASQVIIQGLAQGHFKARDYFARKEMILEAVQDSYRRLAEQYDFLVLEGAGSPAEVNLKPYDFVNMRMAEFADAKCLLVADIDRGGVFASLIGTLDLLEPVERDRIAALVVNKFRGDLSLFDDGIRFLEGRTHKKVLGVLPYDRELWIEEEDSVSIEKSMGCERAPVNYLDIAVIYLPHISNFTDFEILRYQPGMRIRYIRTVKDFAVPDLLILPGTKATMADYGYLLENGFREKILEYAREGGRVLGICGGYQMMGKRIQDSGGVESGKREMAGLGLLDISTEFFPEKVLRRVEAPLSLNLFGAEVRARMDAYEIHMGRTVYERPYESFGEGGAIDSGGCISGTYFHGLFDSREFRDQFFEALRRHTGKGRDLWPESRPAREIKEEQFQRLASLVRNSLDLNFLESLLDCRFE